jgi:hypothetical protein
MASSASGANLMTVPFGFFFRPRDFGMAPDISLRESK